MKNRWSFVVFLLVAASLAQGGSGLSEEMAKLHVQTALVVPSQAIDEFPIWSADSRFLAANIEGKWFKIDTSKLQLKEATWVGQRVGALARKPELEPMSKEEAERWAKQAQHGESVVTGKSGMRAEIQRNSLSASLVLSQGTRTSVIWRTDMENCGELSLSPNGAFLAYICESNGVLVMDLKQSFQASQNQK
jgi:hypothetical protein